MLKPKQLSALASIIDDELEQMVGERMGFALFVVPFNTMAASGRYISNAEPYDMILMLRTLADQLEEKENGRALH